jgi:hypothetical protein
MTHVLSCDDKEKNKMHKVPNKLAIHNKYIIYLHCQNLVPKFSPNFEILNLQVETIGKFCCNFEYCLFKNCLFECCLFV